MKITLIGLGVQEGDLSARAEKALESGAKIFVRTALAPSYKSVEKHNPQSLDYLFESSRNFDTLNKKLASAVLAAAKQSDVIYCVDGAVCEDIACKIILSRHRDTEVYEGVSKAARAASLARLKSTQVTGISAYDIKNLKSTPAAAVYDMDSFFAASAGGREAYPPLQNSRQGVCCSSISVAHATLFLSLGSSVRLGFIFPRTSLGASNRKKG